MGEFRQRAGLCFGAVVGSGGLRAGCCFGGCEVDVRWDEVSCGGEGARHRRFLYGRRLFGWNDGRAPSSSYTLHLPAPWIPLNGIQK